MYTETLTEYNQQCYCYCYLRDLVCFVWFILQRKKWPTWRRVANRAETCLWKKQCNKQMFIKSLTEFCLTIFYLYIVLHTSLRDFRPLRYSSRYGHTEGELVNRGRDTPSFCPTLQMLDMSNIGDAADVNPTNSKTQNALFFLVHAMFRHDCPIAVKPASTPQRLVKKKLGDILYLLIWPFLLCLSWLLRSRVRNFRRDLWITLYFLWCRKNIKDKLLFTNGFL